jgi:hypothetical protein
MIMRLASVLSKRGQSYDFGHRIQALPGGAENLRAISAAMIVFSGVVLGSVAMALADRGDTRIPGAAAGVLVLLGVIAWLVAFKVDKERS